MECNNDLTYLSAQLELDCNSLPPFEAINNYYSDSHEFSEEFKSFSLKSVYIQDENNINDSVGINYIAKLLQHYCPNGDDYNALNKDGQSAIDTYFEVLSTKKEFIEKAVEVANCK